MDIETHFRQIVDRAVEEHGSVLQLSTAAEINNSTFSEWVSGRRSGLNFSTVARLCDYLGVTLNEPKKKAAKKRKAAKRKSAKQKP